MGDLESRLAELASYHVGLFAGSAARIDGSPAAIAHALLLLIQEARIRRREWLDAANPGSESPPPR